MELRDYLRMLRRGWRTVVAVTAITLILAVVYLALTPKRYEATATLLVTANNPSSINDLQQGSQFATTAAVTYAEVIDSATVLGPVAANGRLDLSEGDLEGKVAAAARPLTSLVDVSASDGDAAQAAKIANAASSSALQTIPGLAGTKTGKNGVVRPLVRMQLIRNAIAPSAPVSPNTKRVLALGWIVGLALGLGLTIARQALDTRLRRPEEVRQLTDVPVLAALPHSTRSQRNSVVVRDDPSSRAVEAYRSLRTNLSHLEDGARRSLLFTAVADDHDAVQIPVNLAWSIAQAGRRVLLVDLNLRQSQVGERLGLRNRKGLADVLASGGNLSGVVHKTPQPGLFVVLSGTTQRSPSDMLSGPTMSTVLSRFEDDFDYVILHAPPLLTYTDAAVISRVAGQTLVTVSAGRTRAQDLTTALAALNNVHVAPLGLVLAGVRGSASDNNRARNLWARSRPQTSTTTPPPVAKPDRVVGEPAARGAIERVRRAAR